MKRGSRALGIAASGADDDTDERPLGAAVVRADRVVDGLGVATCTAGGLDATGAACRLVDRCCRPDVQHVLVAGVAPAWYNVLDLDRIATRADRPTIAVSFESSDGLEPALREAFDGAALDERLARYDALPPRRRVDLHGHTAFVRAVETDHETAVRVARCHTPSDQGRPEPLRVARLAARAERDR